jgi:hypothetical protein
MWESFLKFLTLTEVWIGGLGLAAFLALFWVLRGAPPGQAVTPEDDEDAPRGGYRDRVIAAVCIGMLLILLGAYVVATRGVAWSMLPFGLGFATVISLVLINQRYRHGSPTMRRTLDVSSAALNAALVAGVLIVVNVLAFRYGGQAIDVTHERAYSLSTLSLNQVRSLTRPVRFTTFFGRGDLARPLLDRISMLLDLYKAANPEMVRLEHVDPFREQARYDDLVKRAPDVSVIINQGGGIVIEYGEEETSNRLVLRSADLFEIPRVGKFDPDVGRFDSDFKGEDAVTTALMRLREAKKPIIVFTTGHKEPSIDDMETTHPAIGLLRARLNSTGAEVVAVNLLTQDLPEGTSLVVIVGPRDPFQPAETTRLRKYADLKKPLLILLGDGETGSLGELLKGFDVEPGQGVVIEPKTHVPGQVKTTLVPVVNAMHPVVEPLSNRTLVFPQAVPLKVAGQPGIPLRSPDTVTSILVKSTVQSWTKPDAAALRVEQEPKDEHGPFNLAVAVNDKPAPGTRQLGAPRLLVLGSRYLADNATVQAMPANLDLMMNAVGWLRGRPDTLGIGTSTHTALTLTADPGLRARLILVPTVMAVLLIITLGVATYLARRD